MQRRRRLRLRIRRRRRRAHDDGRADDDLQHVHRRRRARRLRQSGSDDVRLSARPADSRRRATPSSAPWRGGRAWPPIPARSYDDVVTIDAAAIEPTVTWGINPGPVGLRGRSAARPGRRAGSRARRDCGSARVHGLRGGQRRSRARRSTWRSSARAPTRGCPICARPRGSCAGRHVAPHVRALVVPGSQAVRLAAEREGLDRVFIEAGFEWRGAGCSMCLAMNPDRLEGREICASSSNRNFKGRQGSPTGRTLLMSPAMVAAAAVAGEVVDIREVAGAWRIEQDRVEISGTGAAAARRQTSTPTGSSRRGFCKSITFEGLEQHLFEDDRRSDAGRRTRTRLEPGLRRRARCCWSNANFGCGSSREHAPQAIRALGHSRASSANRSPKSSSATRVAIGLPCVDARRRRRRALMQPSSAIRRRWSRSISTRRPVAGGAATCPMPLPAAARESFLEARGTRPACCSTTTTRSKPSPRGCPTSQVELAWAELRDRSERPAPIDRRS